MGYLYPNILLLGLFLGSLDPQAHVDVLLPEAEKMSPSKDWARVQKICQNYEIATFEGILVCAS